MNEAIFALNTDNSICINQYSAAGFEDSFELHDLDDAEGIVSLLNKYSKAYALQQLMSDYYKEKERGE